MKFTRMTEWFRGAFKVRKAKQLAVAVAVEPERRPQVWVPPPTARAVRAARRAAIRDAEWEAAAPVRKAARLARHKARMDRIMDRALTA